MNKENKEKSSIEIEAEEKALQLARYSSGVLIKEGKDKKIVVKYKKCPASIVSVETVDIAEEVTF